LDRGLRPRHPETLHLDLGRDLEQDRPVRLAVTTTLDPSPSEEAAARDAAIRHAIPFAPRGNRPLVHVAAQASADALLVLGARRASLFVDGVEHAWRPGMGELRVKRLLEGEAGPLRTNDPFLAAAALEPGDAVLDATLGLGADALVAAAAVGPRGHVVGVEASLPLAALVAEALRRHPSDAGQRITVVAADAADLLARTAPRSFDVVVFDPMFRHPREHESGFGLVRRLADARPLAPETLARARQVARRHVVVKDGTPGWDLARLGLVPLPSARGAKRLYARVSPSES
jgi:16S rRNA (guanine1516-N2)-methyltransferase